jgi:hypothetical protein
MRDNNLKKSVFRVVKVGTMQHEYFLKVYYLNGHVFIGQLQLLFKLLEWNICGRRISKKPKGGF